MCCCGGSIASRGGTVSQQARRNHAFADSYAACLEKDAARRLRHIADARLEIDECLTDRPQPASPWRTTNIAAAIVALLALSAVVAWKTGWLQGSSNAEPSPRFAIELPDALPLEATRQPGLGVVSGRSAARVRRCPQRPAFFCCRKASEVLSRCHWREPKEPRARFFHPMESGLAFLPGEN
jgi:hypothetical protein